jgi:Transposase family tnp2
LILELLLSPNEVSLHKINHYLAPIVDELESLWGGVTLNKTYESLEGKNIRAALILVLCDISAARKICGHVSALVACHRCEKKANYENRKHNFAGMDDMRDWFISRDAAEHRQNALGWRRCNSDAARKRFVKQTGIR